MESGDVSLARALMRSLAFSKSVTHFLQFLVTSVLTPMETRSAAILQLNGNRFEVLGEFGLSHEELTELKAMNAVDPFLMAIIRSTPIAYRDVEEFVQDNPKWISLSSSIPGPCVILPFETLEAIQGAVWVRFHGGIMDSPLSEVERQLILLAGELVVARSQNRLIPTESHDSLMRLTDREKKVLELAKRGFANKQIARELLISESWAKKILQSALSKSGMSSRSELFSRMES